MHGAYTHVKTKYSHTSYKKIKSLFQILKIFSFYYHFIIFNLNMSVIIITVDFLLLLLGIVYRGVSVYIFNVLFKFFHKLFSN